MNTTTLTSRATTGLVAAVAGYASYTHIFKVATEAGEHASVAAVVPLSIDGLILVGTLAMLEDKRSGRRPRLSARLAVAFGVVATLAANIASAQPSTSARLVAAVPPLAFLIAIEVLSRRGKHLATEQDAVAQPAHAAGPVFDHQLPIGPMPARVDKLSTPKPAPKPDRKRPPTAEPRVVAAHRRTPDASDEQLAARLKLSTKTIRRWRPPRGKPAPPVNGHDFALAATGSEDR